MNKLFRSAVFKLTVAYAGMVIGICLIFSAVFYHIAVNELHTGIYNQYRRYLDSNSFGLLQNGNPAGELSARAGHILSELILLNVILLIVTTILSYLLAKRTLRPIARAHEQQKRFTADVSHELRTPLTALRMESEVSLLDVKAPARELRATLESNLEEVGRMESLINNLLMLSSVEAGKLQAAFDSLDVNDLIANAAAAVQPIAAQHGIAIKYEPVGSTRIQGDQPSLTQLLIILLENAVKYSADNETVLVQTVIERGHVTIRISDNGSGISGEALPHIFDRFYRADSSRTGSKGFGLGLSLAKLIADLHDAEIVVSSAEGAGTMAEVRFS